MVQGHDVVVELRQFVIRRPLVHLGEITGCAADATMQVDVLDPGDGGHFFADEFHQAGNGVGVRVAWVPNFSVSVTAPMGTDRE